MAGTCPACPRTRRSTDGIAVDGELVAFGEDGLPSFPNLCDRMHHGKRSIDVMLIVFDLLAVDGRDVTRHPYWERRQLLLNHELEGDAWATSPVYEDGELLWEKVCQLGLEGVVAKERTGHYLPGRRGWIKTKNRSYWRYRSTYAPGRAKPHARPDSVGHDRLRCGGVCDVA